MGMLTRRGLSWGSEEWLRFRISLAAQVRDAGQEDGAEAGINLLPRMVVQEEDGGHAASLAAAV